MFLYIFTIFTEKREVCLLTGLYLAWLVVRFKQVKDRTYIKD